MIVDLEELGAAGYTWQVQDLDREHFEILSVRTGDPPSTGDVTGAPVIKTWLIKATKEGRSELRFFYFRPWEGEKNAAEKFVLKVRICPFGFLWSAQVILAPSKAGKDD